MRRGRAPASPPSPFRALAHHQAHHGSPGQPVTDSASSLIRSFNVETNPTRPIRPSPLTASAIPDMPLDLVDRIRSFPLFLSAPDDFLAAIGKHLRPQVHAAHDHILTEGDDAKAMYWVVRGVVAVTSRDGEAVYAELKPGAFFGEIGVLMDIPRTATIIARTKCLLVVLKKEDLHNELPRFPDMEKAIRQEAQERLTILKKKQQERGHVSSPVDASAPKSREAAPGEVTTGEMGVIAEGTAINSKKRKSPSPGVIEDPAVGGSALGSGYVNVRKTLKELPLFSTLPADILHFLGLSAQPKSYPPFTDIVRQGSPGNEIFFIVRGEAEVIHESPAEHSLRRMTRSTSFARPRLTQGQYFGEVASLGLSPGRTATVRSITAVECLMIGGDALDELWKRCPPELKHQVEETARERYKADDEDVHMQDVAGEEERPSDAEAPSTPRRQSLPQVTFTTPSKPASPTKDDAATRQPSDPDPYLSVDMENMRNRRRNSLAPPPPQSQAQPQSETAPSAHPQPSPAGLNGVKAHAAVDSSPLKLFAFPPTSPASPAPVPRPNGDEERGPSKKARTLLPRRPHSGLAERPALPDDILVTIFQQLDILQLLRMRGVCAQWRRLLATSPKLCTHVDLSPYNRIVNDWSVINILAPFIGARPVVMDISNCFHITDEGFQALWLTCGKNVKTWRMRSVWDVSANQILEMSENAKGLEEVDWSNCRKVGDNLLARVVGWVVPPLPPPAAHPNKNVVIASSSSAAKAARNAKTHAQRLQPPPNGPPPGTVVGCPNLKRLDLSYCKHITDRSMGHLAVHTASRLQSLSLTRCTSITDAGFQSWAPFRFTNLTHLCLADCTYLSDNAVVALVHAAKNLTHLDLSFCCALSDTATEVVALGLPMLTELRLAFCGSAVSDASLGCVALHLNDLKGLSVRGCVRVTGTGVESVLEGCGRLEWLDVSQCKNLTQWLIGGGVGRWGYDEKGNPGAFYQQSGAWRPPTLKSSGTGPNPVPSHLAPGRSQRRRARRPVKFIVEKGTSGLR